MGSFAVEKFSVERLIDLGHDEIDDRVRAFKELTSFETLLPVEQRD